MAGMRRAGRTRALVGAGLVACGRPEAQPRPATPTIVEHVSQDMAQEAWLKGQLHLHTANSGDSETPAAAALRWYAAHGFDFVVVTDHNFVTLAPAPPGPLVVAPGVELTQNVEGCEPAPEPGLRCLLHVNALFVAPQRAGRVVFPPASSPRRFDLFARALRASEELGGVAMLNHPNFHYAADAGLLAELAGSGLRLFELANAAVDSNNAGDATHASTEALWDAALGRGARLFAVATDDAHHYDDAPAVTARGETAYVGDRGFVVVRARRDAESVREALLRGEFYASTGVLLRSVTRGEGRLEVEAAEAGTIEFVGAGGEVLRTITGARAAMSLAETSGPYLRARVRGPAGAMAWTQPIWRE
jgi:hypothetical protein